MLRKEFETELICPVAICDVEIANDISSENGEWNYKESDIITLGIFYGKKIIVLQREKTDKINFWKECLRKELENMPVMFCFNVLMEKGSILGFLGLNRFFEEIKPFKGRGGSKENMFYDLKKNNQIPNIEILDDPLNGDSRLVIDKYAENKYEEIILHNYNCLMKEFFIFLNRFWFLETYGDKIKNGWWNHHKPFGEHYEN